MLYNLVKENGLKNFHPVSKKIRSKTKIKYKIGVK